MFVEQEVQQAGLADTFGRFLSQSLTISSMELRKLYRDPTEVFSRAVQPTLWLVVFGKVFSNVRGIPTGNIPYLDFMTPGILAQSVLFSAIFYGIAVIWERDMGVVHKLLVSPAYRGALVLGKAVSAGFRGIVQTVIIYLIALLMGIGIQWNPVSIVGVLFGVMLGSAIFSTFSLIMACIVKTRERFMGIGQVLTMPLFFASNAIYPISIMPDWLKMIAQINPLTYLVDALRGMMLTGGQSLHGLPVDFAIMGIGLLLLLTIAARFYPTLVR
ncbi:MAG TPA: ABC transporter permease [Candidatus Kapabacteria bacterium]|nr:ABC transporter permease [Candidatus Kapabacteria bacterium]